MTPEARSADARKGALLVLAASIMGATSGIVIRAILTYLPIMAMPLAFWREFITFLFLACGLALVRPGLLHVERRDLGVLMTVGMVGLGPFHVLWVLAVSRVTIATATILHYTAPAFVVLFSYLIWREAITRRRVSALALTFLGVVLVVRPFDLSMLSTDAAGLAASLGTGVTFALYSIFGKQALLRYSPWTVMAFAFGFSSIAVLAIHSAAYWRFPVLPLQALGGMALLTLVCTILPFALYMAGLRYLPAGTAAIIMAFEVVAAMLFGFLAFGEPIVVLQALGALLIVLGIVLVNRGERQATKLRPARSASARARISSSRR